MKKYIDYILETIINDVNYFGTIYDNYQWLTWIIVCIFWLWWIFIKNILFLMPIWLLWNLTLGSTISNLRKKYKV